tara:strand:- start:239 stop:499 length:261 start_codon:yes stop_codon:yes gene_type:complete
MCIFSGMKLIIDIDVLNPEEVMRSHRGEIVGLMAGIVMSHEKKKYKVEKAICEEMINILKVELPKALKEELIEANASFSIEDNQVD